VLRIPNCCRDISEKTVVEPAASSMDFFCFVGHKMCGTAIYLLESRISQHASSSERVLGSLPRSGGAGSGDQGREISHRLNHLKTADAAVIEMGVLFLCEVDAVSGESTDTQDMNVAFCHRKTAPMTHAILFGYLPHYLPPFT